MTLKARLKAEDHAKLPDALKTEYTKNTEGIFVLAVEEVDGWTLDDTTGLRNTVKSERKRADDAEANLRDARKQTEGIDLAKARDALKRIDAIDAGEPDDKTKAKIASITRQLDEKYAAELTPLKQTLAEREAEIDALTIDRAIADELGKVKLIEGAAGLLQSHIRATNLVRRVKGADGKTAVRVFGHDGIELMTREAGKSGNASVAELVNVVLRKEHPGLYVASEKKGAGASGDSSGGNVKNAPEGVMAEQRLANAWSD